MSKAQEPKPERQTRTVPEAAAVLGISKALAYEMAHSGQLPTIRCGRRVLVPQKALDAMLEAGNRCKRPYEQNGSSPGATAVPSD